MARIGIYTATENELGSIGRAAERLEGVELVVRSESDLESEADIEEFVEELTDATAAVFWLHGAEDSMPGYEYATGALEDAGVPLIVKATGDAYAVEDTTVSAAHRDLAYEYLEKGGTINTANLCRFLAAEYEGRDVDYDEPTSLPTEGVYHPDYPGIEYEGLLETHDPDKPTVAVWFYESHWTHENTRYVDAQVRALEEQGANALPIFCNPATDTEEQEDAEWVTDNWLIDADGQPVVDAVLSSFMFSLSMDERGRSASNEGSSAEDVFLDRLGVPVLQTVTTMRSRSRYESSDTGVMGFELALSVALPEFDGNVITHPISGKERTDDEAGIGSAPKHHYPIEDRVDHATRLAVNWAQLRHTPNEDKRVVVVLHNYPPSDDGIGTAFGLDSPESTVNLLEELEARGYELGDDMPEDGQTLVEKLTAQLTLEDRWVAPEDVRDLSVDVVSADTYEQWFSDADERFQENVLEEWGEVPDRPFAIPGVEFGNVLVTVQPPRGFGMDPSKVYHDSDLQPPHDYYAFYGWLRNEFEVDGFVHLGTHGSLEWLPGKTVGLNGASAPDQLIDDIPNVYPYIVNNPGEGTQAKRRSYAAIVDYLTPVMRNAGTYDELSELEELANQYREAGMEDARADDGEHLEDLMRETVEELDLAVELGIAGTIDEKADVRGPDEAGSTLAEGAVEGEDLAIDALVERIHEYLTDVKTTQIRLGLHTMSEPPDGERLVEYLLSLIHISERRHQRCV
ncbi:cobaltochelatase subunit CobN [Natronorubrum sulfidifaciens]|uniref:cobaltochelatase subunit CobN n=1 Tax=Natronorubrum sulfidifaciens TaxID=388259 RepID=UPI00267AA783